MAEVSGFLNFYFRHYMNWSEAHSSTYSMCTFEYSVRLKAAGADHSSSSSQAGPEAYTSDAPQPRGLLCNPGSPPPNLDVPASANHSSRGVLPTVVCRCVWSRNHKNPREWGGGQGPLGGYRANRKKKSYITTDIILPTPQH